MNKVLATPASRGGEFKVFALFAGGAPFLSVQFCSYPVSASQQCSPDEARQLAAALMEQADAADALAAPAEQVAA